MSLERREVCVTPSFASILVAIPAAGSIGDGLLALQTVEFLG